MSATAQSSRTSAPTPATNRLRTITGGVLRGLLEQSIGPTEKTLIQLVSPVGEPVVAPGTDPALLHLLAEELGLVERLGASRARFSLSSVPKPWIERWSEGRQSHAVANLLLVREEARLLGALQSAGIQAIPLKGVSLARILHGDPVARCVTDLDLGVRRSEVARAGAVLEQRGYATQLPRGLLAHDAFLRCADEHTAEAGYGRDEEDLQLLVELHWKVLPLEEEVLWSSLHEYDAPGPQVRTLAPDLYLLYLCAHSTGHSSGSLRWLCDVADFLLAFSERIDPSEFLRKCLAAQLRRRVRLSLDLVEAYFCLRWEPAEKLHDASDERLAEEFLLRPLVPELKLSLAATHGERLRLLDNNWQRLRYLGRLAQPTRTELDRGRGRLRSRPMAWLVRTGRLAQLAWSSWGRRQPS